jgi:hypothetical protein
MIEVYYWHGNYDYVICELKIFGMKKVFVIASFIIAVSTTSCGNQKQQPVTNTPTAPDSALSNGTEGTRGDTGTINNSTPNNNMDTSKNDSLRKKQNPK